MANCATMAWASPLDPAGTWKVSPNPNPTRTQPEP